MANNRIQIKRSTTTAITNTTPSVNAGELIFSSNGYILAIGDPANAANVIAIGGARYPGTLTANQAIVVNTTSGVDKLITANLTLGGASVTVINAVANLTTLGTPSNTELTTTWAIKTFVDAKIAQASNPQGTNGQFQYNDSGVLNGTNNMVFDKTTGQISIGNTTVNVQIGYTGSINSLAHFHGNQNSYVQVNMNNVNNGTRASSDFVAENDLGDETQNFVDLGINSSTYNDPAFSAMGAGDSYLYAANNNLTIGTADAGALKFITGGTTSTQIRVVVDAGGNVGIGNTNPNAKLQVTGTANISGLVTLGANLVLTAPLIANGTSGSSGQLLTSNGTTGAPYWAAAPTTVAGSTTQVQYNDGGSLAGAAGLTFAKATNNVTIANNLFVTSAVNAATLSVGTSIVANSTRLALDTAVGLQVNGTIGTAGQILYSNGTTGYWADAPTGDITEVTAGSGLTGGGTSGAVTVNVGAGNGISVSADAVAVSAGTDGGLTVNSTGVWVLAGSGLLTNSSGLHVGSGSGISTAADSVSVLANTSAGLIANTTGVHVKVGSGLGFDGSGNLQVTGALSVSDVTVSGNLTVLGDLVSLNVATLTVEDSMITLAKDQSATTTYTDALDIGFFGTYGNTANAFVSGLFRDQSDSGIWKLFTSNGTYTNATINTANTNAFGLATLQAYLQSSGLVTNVGSVYITANATVNVNISANVLSLSGRSNNDLLFTNGTGGVTARALGISGYVVQSNGTAIVYDTLDGGTF